ncbi:MAG: TIGR04282 family arsenosugar biosynthesis glycosyltransferase [Gammaproteobacteria bacterium]|nr:TIGR04282 family arsenosugar biosynthesis glycosyltransferase [Gammaproteobacteria bacterium]
MTSSLCLDASLLIFARAPVPGHCKTRLIPLLGDAGAAELQQELILSTVDTLCRAHICHTQLWCSPDINHPCFEFMSNKYGINCFQQQGAGLGERMHDALSKQTTDFSIIVGTDIPELQAEHITQAIKTLQQGRDAVIGPAEDGGYYLIGIKRDRLSEGLFQGIQWGRPEVFQQTIEKLNASGLAWESISSLWDLDNAEDYKRYKRLKNLRG